MSARPEPLPMVRGTHVVWALALSMAGCQQSRPDVDPEWLYGSWSVGWPRFSGSPDRAGGCGVGTSGVTCGWTEVRFWEVAPEDSRGEAPSDGFEVEVGQALHDCELSWPRGTTSTVRWDTFGGRRSGEVRDDGKFVSTFLASFNETYDIECSLTGRDTLECTEWNRLDGQGRLGAFTFYRVDRTAMPVLCDRLLEEALLVGDVLFRSLGDHP